jgi:hypothetical protein
MLVLAAVAMLAACHNRPDDEVGAAPDRRDTTMAEPWSGPGIAGDTTGDTASVQTDPGMSADTTIQDY